MAILAVVPIGRAFRITIPKEVRDHLQLTEKNEIIFYSLDGMKGRVGMRRG